MSSKSIHTNAKLPPSVRANGCGERDRGQLLESHSSDPPAAGPESITFLVGSPRSGTTWLGNILNSDRLVVYRHEPFSKSGDEALTAALGQLAASSEVTSNQRQTVLENLCRGHHPCCRPPFFPKDYSRLPSGFVWLSWLCARMIPGTQRGYRWLLTVKDLNRLRVVIKQGSIPKQLPTLTKAFAPHIVLIVRHPCGVIASRLTGNQLGVLRLPDRTKWLKAHGESAATLGYDHHRIQAADDVEMLAIQWLVENTAYLRIAQSHGNCHFVNYERLCVDPFVETKQLFGYLGWEVGEQTERFLCRSTSQLRRWRLSYWLQSSREYFSVYRNPDESANRWKSELSASQKERILAIVRPLVAEWWPESC